MLGYNFGYDVGSTGQAIADQIYSDTERRFSLLDARLNNLDRLLNNKISELYTKNISLNNELIDSNNFINWYITKSFIKRLKWSILRYDINKLKLIYKLEKEHG